MVSIVLRDASDLYSLDSDLVQGKLPLDWLAQCVASLENRDA